MKFVFLAISLLYIVYLFKDFGKATTGQKVAGLCGMFILALCIKLTM